MFAWGHEINDHIKNDKSGRYLLKSDFKRELGQDDLANKCCKVPEDFYHSVRCRKVTPEDFVFRSTKEDTFVIGVKSGSLITEKRICKLPLENGEKHCDPGKDILKAAVIERHGKTSNIGLGFVQGFGIKSGALATTVSHDSHNICVVGTSDEDIAAAVNALNILQGGSVVIRDGKTMASLPLSVAGLLTDRTYNEFNADLQKLMTAAAQIGCTLPEPFYQLSFLALPVIPHLKLTDKGLFDVDVFQHIRQN